MQHVEQLPLVLVQPLHLHVEERIPIDRDLVLRLDVARQLILVALLDPAHLVAEDGVVGVRRELGQLVEVRDPALADARGDRVGQ